MTTDAAQTANRERADLTWLLAKNRYFLRHTVQGLTDEQASLTPTVSALCLGGLIKHVAATERQWVRFILEGPASMAPPSDGDYSAYANAFKMLPGETLEGLLTEYEQVAAETDELVQTLPDLEASQPLPSAPWFEPGARWTARQVFMHISAETAQHAGHADIIRETIDGQKSMG